MPVLLWMKSNLNPFIPSNSLGILEPILVQFSGTLVISRPRKSKLGDFRVNIKTGECRISINNDLNPYAFLITLLHELAHFKTWEKYSNKVKPHGKEWKSEFSGLLTKFIDQQIFPEKIVDALSTYVQNPKASSCTDERLFKALQSYDSVSSSSNYVSELQTGEKFTYHQRGGFTILKKLRKRILCEHHKTGKRYLFQPTTKVEKIIPK